MPNLNSVYMWHRPPDKEKLVTSVVVEVLEMLSNFLSHKHDGRMKLNLKDSILFRPTHCKTLV